MKLAISYFLFTIRLGCGRRTGSVYQAWRTANYFPLCKPALSLRARGGLCRATGP